MRRRSFRSGRGRRRSVAWIPGLTTYDTANGLNARAITLAVVRAAVPNTFGAAVQMTTDADLSLHGGEDAVITRILGRLYFTDGTGAVGAATGYQLRVVLAYQDVNPDGTTAATDFTTSDGLGIDNILWEKDVIVSSVATAGAGTGLDGIVFTEGFGMLDIDCKAQRKLQSNSQLILWFQTVTPAAAARAFVLRGGLRMLLKRPR